MAEEMVPIKTLQELIIILEILQYCAGYSDYISIRSL